MKIRSLIPALFALALSLVPMESQAANSTVPVTINNATFTDLGAAPVMVQSLGNSGYALVIVADSTPSTCTGCGFYIQPQLPPLLIPAADGGSHAYAIALGSASVTLIVSPSESSGGGGGGGSVTQGTTPWVDNITQVGGASLNLGQTTMSGGLPVAIASDQSALTVAQSTASSLHATVIGAAAAGAAPSGAPVLTGNFDGTDVRNVLGDTSGRSVVVGAGTAGTGAGGVISVQGVGSGVALPISAAALPLPTGAATSANQSTEITSLGTIATNSGLASTLATATTGGDTSYHLIAANSNNSTLVSTGAHTIYEVQVTNYGTNLGDLRIYDSATAPTCSSATGVIRNWPAQSNATSPGYTYSFPLGIAIASGLGFCFTGAVADNDNTSFAGTNAVVNIGYK